MPLKVLQSISVQSCKPVFLHVQHWSVDAAPSMCVFGLCYSKMTPVNLCKPLQAEKETLGSTRQEHPMANK